MKNFLIVSSKRRVVEEQWNDEFLVELKVSDENNETYNVLAGNCCEAYTFWKSEQSIIDQLAEREQVIDTEYLNDLVIGSGEYGELYKLQDSEFWPVIKCLVYAVSLMRDDKNMDLDGKWMDQIKIPEMEEFDIK